MSSTDTLTRSLHDLGAAAWFGGSTMGAIGLNGAANDVADPADRAKVAAYGWARWSPVNALAIGAHLAGGAGLLISNRGRVKNQSGASANTVAKLAVTGAALGTTAYSGVLGAKIGKAAKDGRVHAEGGVLPSDQTPPDIAKAQQQLRLLQWLTPLLTAVLVVLGAQQGEQQKPTNLVSGAAKKISRRKS